MYHYLGIAIQREIAIHGLIMEGVENEFNMELYAEEDNDDDDLAMKVIENHAPTLRTPTDNAQNNQL